MDNLIIVAEGETDATGRIARIVPDVRNARIMMSRDGEKWDWYAPKIERLPQIVKDDQIVKIYWTYGESHIRLSDMRGDGDDVIWQPKYRQRKYYILVTMDDDIGLFRRYETPRNMFEVMGAVREVRLMLEVVGRVGCT